MNKRQLKYLQDVLALPTAPFREQHVADWVRRRLAQARVPNFFDPDGNLVVGISSAAAYRKLVRKQAREPLRLFIAHMDHPGFHGVRWLSKRRLSVEWHGGSPTRRLRGTKVWLATDQGYVGQGQLQPRRLHKSGLALATAEVRLDRDLSDSLRAADIYGGFAFRSTVWRSGNRLYTKAADDLVGVFATVETAIALFRQRRGSTPFLGLLTRAEEVGFVGALAHFELGWLAHARRKVVCVSLETSRTLPGALVGKGPVVRLGDRRTVFDPNALKILSDVALKTLPGAHQRRVMDGGTCEATAATVYGLSAIGVSVPLGNYHNEAYEGGPDSITPRGPAPEFVDIRDVDGLLRLCRALCTSGLPWESPWQDVRKRLDKNRRAHRARLHRSNQAA
ncbi:MAG: hypothetical protein JSW09_01240 [Pseudomonadota bacterium]|nr:MAG: hypothetical protein JSW09_01240 [Pseudomonadota bacterium]